MIYFKIFDIDQFDTDYETEFISGDETVPVGSVDDGYVYHFHGTIDVTTKEDYLYEKELPFEVDKYVRVGKHFTDNLKISIKTTAKDYENLYFASIRNTAYLIAWDTCTGFQYRWTRATLPYPSKVRFLDGKVDFTAETIPYKTINRTLRDNFMKNFRWNRGTMRSTVWN